MSMGSLKRSGKMGGRSEGLLEDVWTLRGGIVDEEFRREN